MKKIIILILAGILLMNFVSAENCQLAVPRYGAVECNNMGSTEILDIPLQHAAEISTATFPCISYCELNTVDDIPEISCGVGFGAYLEIYVDGELKYKEESLQSRESKNIKLNYGQELLLRGYCSKLIGKGPLTIGKIQIKQDLVMLKEGWAGTKPITTISGTEGCILNKAIDEDTNINSYLDVNSGTQKSKPSSSYTSLSSFPNNWRVGEHYVYVKDWDTGIADISLAYDKNNNAFWCGGEIGNRKLYNVDKIRTVSGKCYSIPKSISRTNLECCEDVDCLAIGLGAQYVCNPDNWKCEKTKPCNSQLDCESTFGKGICQNKEMNEWICDMNKKWGNYAGTCTNKITKVFECESDCTNNEYYDDNEGKCKPLVTRLNCPAEKCCIAGGNYYEKPCNPGQKCCTIEGGHIGNCAVECQEINQEESIITPKSIDGSSKRSSSVGLIILLVIIGLIGVSIVVFIVMRNKGGGEASESKSNTCKKCGSKLISGNEYCTQCGRKV